MLRHRTAISSKKKKKKRAGLSATKSHKVLSRLRKDKFGKKKMGAQ